MKYFNKHTQAIFKWFSAALLTCVGLFNGAASADDIFIFDAAPAAVAPPAAGNGRLHVIPALPSTSPPGAIERRTAVTSGRLERTVLIPTVSPNPLAFNFRWLLIKAANPAAANVRADVRRQQMAQVQAALARRRPGNAAQVGADQQFRRMLEPMLKVELSFAVRAAKLNAEERQNLIVASKQWFDTYVANSANRQNPNARQMIMQNGQAVWANGQAQQIQDPREPVRSGVARVVAMTVPKEKADAYLSECRKRAEFAHQVAIENLVERVDDKVKLSPDQWKSLNQSLMEHMDKSRVPQLEVFAMNASMSPGAPEQWVVPVLSTAQQAIWRRINRISGRVFFGGGIMAGMLGNDGVIDDIDLDDAEAANNGNQMPVEKLDDSPFE